MNKVRLGVNMLLQGTLIRHLGKHVGEEVTVQGWLYNKRSSGKIQFLIMRDGTGIVQGVLVKKEAPELFEMAKNFTQESALRVKGVVREESRSVGGYELTVTGLEIISLAEEYPISHKEHGVDFLMDRRHLWMRTPRKTLFCGLGQRLNRQLGISFMKTILPWWTARLLHLLPARGLLPCLNWITTVKKHSFPRVASFITKHRPWRWEECIASDQPSGQKNLRPAVT
ncbi:hypothetical protein N752_03745 [Desulforamulus aquiferis]|nr:hypothetical protein N752_03745 [Desulforamulus aquiferis]